MVAAAPPPSAPKTAPDKSGGGESSMLTQPMAITPVQPKYDLTKLVQDYADGKQITQQFTDNVIIKLHYLYHQLDPQSDFVKGTNAAGGRNKIKQKTHPGLSFLIDKGLDYLLSGSITARVPEEFNPRMSPMNRQFCANIVNHTWRWNDRYVPGINSHYRRAFLLMLEGAYLAEYQYLLGDDPDLLNNGYPLKLTVHSTRYCMYDLDANHTLTRVIVAKRRLAGELPPKWQAAANLTQPQQDTDVYEHWDRVNHGVVVNGTVVKPLTPHGYMDMSGAPMIPFVLRMHHPQEYLRQGQTPQSTGLSATGVIIGHPPAENLIGTIESQSEALTLTHNALLDSGIPEKVVKGLLSYDPARRLYEVDPKDGSVTLLNNEAALGPLLAYTKYYDDLAGAGGASNAVLGGQPITQSGTANQAQTMMPKRMYEAVQETLEAGLEAEAMMQLAMIAGNAEPSTARKFQATHGTPLRLHTPETSKLLTNGNPLPYSEDITGDPNIPIDALTVRGVRRVIVSVSPYESLPREQGIELGKFLMSQQQKPVPIAFVLGELMGFENADALVAATHANMLRDQSELSAIDAKLALLTQYEGDIDPATLNTMRQQLQGQKVAELQKVLAQQQPAPAPGGNPPPGGPPHPGGPPQGGPPPGPPMPQMGPPMGGPPPQHPGMPVMPMMPQHPMLPPGQGVPPQVGTPGAPPLPPVPGGIGGPVRPPQPVGPGMPGQPGFAGSPPIPHPGIVAPPLGVPVR